ncbi:coiled-coil domain-containing protein 96 [Tachysurus fulvidraco]|uniref:coiled-coil domain-containing protein 96 n=1 Tax=Tachysurus fulvidraco TaxID=1234273 RepID=UPI001FF02C84|nr:coiled-coil domain-containing protein 96 [Tachysurus fulvidraco]XP_026995046.2 coiled-coil domain-containing protein 96 [Tachysurus fulvidraco]XP_026995047.2 coiled-coil domain-containing protein 96 [Tachysurus fulvidraco]
MEEQSLEETGPVNVAETAEIIDSDDLTKPDDERCAVEEVEEIEQAATEEDELRTMLNAPGIPEEEFEDSLRDDLQFGDEVKERVTSDVENFQNKYEEQVEECKQSTADLQPNLLDTEDEQELLRELQTEHEKLSRHSYQLQNTLAEYFCLKSAGELQQVQDKMYPNQESCETYPDIIEDIKRQKQEKKQKQLQQQHLNDLLQQNNEKLEQIELEWSTLMSAKREVLITELEKSHGKMEAQAITERRLTAAQKCEDEFVSVRHENFKLNLKMPKLEPGIHVRNEDLGKGMQYVDFEQLNIENQNYSKKIQECTEDLLKLKRTLPQTGQILMHMKEKLRYVKVENQEKQVHFDELDALVLHEQKALTQTMQARDTLRFDNLRRRQDCGLLGNTTLLRNFEDTEDEREALERQIEMLKRSRRDIQDHTDANMHTNI